MASSNFVDYVKIYARSGNGGPGSSHFRREKFVEFGGPDGGDGGRGGHVILRGNSQYWTLIHLKYQRHQMAENGEGGSGAKSHGRNGKDIVLDVPLGTVAKDAETGETVAEVTEDKQEVILVRGGRGGLGNWHFRTATNQAPRYSQPGEPMQEGWFILEPNLGIVEVRDGHSFVMADIPGIIEGAHEGKGIGTRFLRHIERNSVLLFMIPADTKDIVEEYRILLNELKQYNPEMLDKRRLLAITKSDMLDEELTDALTHEIEAAPELHGIPRQFISSVTGLHIREIKDMLWETLTKD